MRLRPTRLREAVATSQLPQLQRGTDDESIRETDYSTAERIELAKRGAAIPIKNGKGVVVGGRYPIKTAQDVKNAVNDVDRIGAGAAERAHVITNAQRVDAMDEIPESWHRLVAGLKRRKPESAKPTRSASGKGKAGKGSKTKPARESMPFRVLIREALGKTGDAYEATILREGPGNPGDRNYYTKQALKQAVAAGMFEGLQAYMNHPTPDEERQRPERDVRQLAGHFREARYVDGNPAEVRGKFLPGGMDQERVVALIESALAAPAGKPLIGISIDGHGHAPDQQEVNGRTYHMVREITHLGSADIVTRAGAGGQFHRRLSESLAGARDSVGDARRLTGRQLQKVVRKALRRLEGALADEDDDQVREAFVALHEAASASVTLPTASAVSGDKLERAIRARKSAEAKLEKQRKRRRLAEQRAELADRGTLAGRLLREVNVPAVTREAWFSDLIEQPDETAMGVLLDRRQAERQSHITEIRESLGLDRVEGCGPREPVGPTAPVESGLLERLGIDPDDL